MPSVDDLTKQLEKLQLDKDKASTQGEKDIMQTQIDKLRADIVEANKNNAGVTFTVTSPKAAQ